MGCICVLTKDDFEMIERIYLNRSLSNQLFDKVRFINQTSTRALLNVQGTTPEETKALVGRLKALAPETRSIKYAESRHIFPQAKDIKERFKKYDINVDDYTVLLDKKEHQDLGNKKYNLEWEMILDYCDLLDEKEGRDLIIKIAGQLSGSFGWTGAGIQKHRSHNKEGYSGLPDEKSS